MGKRGGTQSSGQCSPQLERCPAQASGGNMRPARMTERGMWLAVSRLQMRATRGVLCRARGRGEASVRAAKQPGRERPPAAPDPGPRRSAGSPRPGCVSQCPDTRAPRASSIRHRGGPRVGRPLVAHRASRRSRPYVNLRQGEGADATDQAAHARKQLVTHRAKARSREQRDAVCVRTFPGRVARVRPEPVDRYRARARQGVHPVANRAPEFIRARFTGSRTRRNEFNRRAANQVTLRRERLQPSQRHANQRSRRGARPVRSAHPGGRDTDSGHRTMGHAAVSGRSR